MVTKKRAASKVSKSVFSGTMHNVLAESIAALSSCFSASRVTSIRSCIDIPYYPILSNISFTYPILSNRFLDTLLCSGKCQTCHCRTSDGKSIFDPIQAHSLSSKYACLQTILCHGTSSSYRDVLLQNRGFPFIEDLQMDFIEDFPFLIAKTYLQRISPFKHDALKDSSQPWS